MIFICKIFGNLHQKRYIFSHFSRQKIEKISWRIGLRGVFLNTTFLGPSTFKIMARAMRIIEWPFPLFTCYYGMNTYRHALDLELSKVCDKLARKPFFNDAESFFIRALNFFMKMCIVVVNLICTLFFL